MVKYLDENKGNTAYQYGSIPLEHIYEGQKSLINYDYVGYLCAKYDPIYSPFIKQCAIL